MQVDLCYSIYRVRRFFRDKEVVYERSDEKKDEDPSR